MSTLNPPEEVELAIAYAKFTPGAAKRVWTFDSLKSAIDVGFAEMLLDEKRRVRLFKRWGKPSIAADPCSVYCSLPVGM